MKEFFRHLMDFSSNQSSGRFILIFSVLFSNFTMWGTWIIICLWTRSFVDIPVGVYTAYGIANGVAVAGKGVQSFAERPAALLYTKSKIKEQESAGSAKAYLEDEK